MNISRWHKKDVDLTWNGERTRYAVAQELFSSHDVDAGSKLLLKSLDTSRFPDSGLAVDFGCGYGVLGLAWKHAMPGWNVLLIDRDALAVEFSQWNATAMGFTAADTQARTGLGVDFVPPDGASLILWNVPGKAGESAIEALTADVMAALTDNGTAAMVVVNPLASVIRSVLDSDTSVTVLHDEAHSDHTIIHATRTGAPDVPADPFDRGVFDREAAGFGVDDFEYDITPVMGLPEYDSYSFATQVTFDMLRTITREIESALVFRPGQGHLATVIASVFQPESLALLDRDMLALRASVRAMVDAGVRVSRLGMVAASELADAKDFGTFTLVAMMLEDQVRNDVHAARLEDLANVIESGGQLIVGGTSSVVSRFLSFAAKANGWKVRDRTKRSGASAARLERME
jgi:16S rRNA G1207 methylase RsmC